MTSASDLAGRLGRILEAEEQIYLEMRSVLQREQSCIVRLDAVDLEDAVRSKEALAEEARLLEESRLEVTETLAAALGLGLARPSLSQLCDRLGEEATELRAAHTRLVALVGAVRELLHVNVTFAGDSLDRVRATLKLLGRLLPERPVYVAGGSSEWLA